MPAIVTIRFCFSLILTLAALLGLGAASSAQADAGAGEKVAWENAKWFDGKRFVEGRKVTVRGVFIDDNAPADRTVDLSGGYVIPPFGDAHTHQFDGPWTFEAQNDAQLRSGTFYVMTMTAPTSGVAQIRHRFDDWATADVATSLGGLTGPSSHPAEIYEAVALRIFSFEEQVARQDEIRASTRARGDAYWVVEDEASLQKAWRELIRAHPDFVKVYLRHSSEYADRRDDNWAIGGVAPALLPMIAERAKSAGIRLAIATSDVSDFRAALDVNAEIITHIPCYQDTSDPGIYFYADTDEKCLLTEDDAVRAVELGTAITLIASEFAKDQADHVRKRLEANVGVLRDAGANFVVGSNAYSETITAGLVAESKRRLFSPAELLRMAAINTPRVIFPGRNIGCLDAGCEASFLVLSSNPLEDMSSIDKIAQRIKRGRPLEIKAVD